MKAKNFIVIVTLLNFSYVFRFSFSPFSISFLYLLLYEEFSLFLGSSDLKNNYRYLQVLVMILNKKPLGNIFRISNSKNLPWNLSSLVLKIVVNKTVCRIALVLLWFQIIGKTIKILGFHNNTHMLNLPVLMCHPETLLLSHIVSSCLEPCRASKMEPFVKIVNDF